MGALKEQVAALRADAAALKEREHDLASSLSEQRERTVLAESSVEGLTREIERHRGESESLRALCVELEQVVRSQEHEASAERERLASERSGIKLTLVHEQATARELRESLRDLQGTAAGLAQQEADLRRQLTDRREAAARAESAADSLAREIETHQREVKTHRQEAVDLRAQLAELERTSLSERADAQGERERWLAERHELKLGIAQEEGVAEELRAALREAEAAATEREERANRLEAERDEIARALEAERERTGAREAEREDLVKALEAEREELAKALQAEREELTKRFEAQREELAKGFEAQREELARAHEAEREELARERKAATVEGERRTAEIASLRSEIAGLQEREQAAQRQAAELADALSAQVQASASLEADRDGLAELLEEEDKRSAGLESRVAELAGALDEMSQQVARLDSIRERATAQGTGKARELEELTTRLKTLDRELLESQDASLRAPAVAAPDPAASPMEIVPDRGAPSGPIARPGLKVAAIVDDFSRLAYQYEFDLIQFGQDDWREVLERTRPDFLFVESAWRGNDGRWNYTMTKSDSPRPPLVDLVTWCREQGIPTVFWNKEDPSNFDVFYKTALLFDHVFTVDGNCVPRYRELGHESVAVLPFAAQPRVHNPVRWGPEVGSRDVAFAGSYYGGKHPARLVQMEAILEPAREFGLEIFSRFEDNPKYRFPDGLAEHVVGSLPYLRMVDAYKLYKVFLNVNSVIDSPTMCARRIFELLASGVNVLSGPAPSISRLLGPELVLESADQERTKELLAVLLRSPELRDRQAQLGARQVLDAHTYGHRVSTILAKLGLEDTADVRQPEVSILCPTKRPEQIDAALENAARQTYARKELVLVLHGLDVDAGSVARRAKEMGLENVTVLEAAPDLTLGACMNLAVGASSGSYLSKFDDDNFYAAEYLGDLIRSFSYTDAGVVGKWACYTYLAKRNCLMLRFPRFEHRYVNLVQGGTMTFTREVADELPFADLPRAVDTTFLRACKERKIRVYASDRFNFVSIRQATAESHTWKISDEQMLMKGIVQVYGSNFDHVVV
jgi:hypothetical protein